MNERSLSRLVGYLLGDASLKRKKRYKRTGTQVELSIEATDLSLVEDFRNLCKRFVGREVGKITNRKRSKNWRKSFSFSCKVKKDLAELLYELSPTYNTKPKNGVFPPCRIPKIVFKNKDNTINFLQAFVNCEGSVRLKVVKHKKWWELSRYVKISAKHPVLLEGTSKLLKLLEIHHRFAPKNNPIAVIVQSKYAIKKFQETIGFMRGIKVSPRGLWGGFEKSKVLEIVVKSFELQRGELQKFSNENEIYEFLKRC